MLFRSGQPCRLPTCPPLRSTCPQESRLRPDALRLPEYLQVVDSMKYRDLSPLLPDGGGWRDGESFALPHRSAVWELSPTCRTEPGHRSGGQVASRATQQPRSQVYPCPSPGRGITASRWRFGMVSRCSAYGAQGQPGTVGREGDKSVEAVPRPWLTFNLAQMHRGEDKIGPRSAGYPLPRVSHIRRPESPQ